MTRARAGAGTRPTFICGGDLRPGPRDECPSPLHDWPLPVGYVDAAAIAARRLRDRWSNVRCADCGCYGWRPGRARDDDVRVPAPDVRPAYATGACPMCHATDGHVTVPRPDDPTRRVACPNGLIEQGRFERVVGGDV